jgi:hypothetical protein
MSIHALLRDKEIELLPVDIVYFFSLNMKKIESFVIMY